MKITVLTSNKSRHNYLVNKLSNVCKKLFIIQENSTIFPGVNPGRNKQSNTMKKYFQKVNNAQNFFFYDHKFLKLKKNCKLLSLQMGDVNNIKLKDYKSFFQSNLYIVFGTSFIKGKILNFLKKNKAINLHMGLSPYYRGTDCNFWALYDRKLDKIGATIHLLNEVLDAGKILYVTKTLNQKDSFKLTMSAVKLAIDTLVKKIKSREILKLKSIKQDKSLEIRFSKKRDFTDKVVKRFMKNRL